jgi:hypothetical protein
MAIPTTSFTGSPLHIGTNDLVAAFTNAYLNIMQELISYETPGHAVFGNKGNLVEWGKGVTATFPTRKPARRGIVGDISNRVGRIPRGGRPTYAMAQFEAMTHRLAINFDWNAMNTASNERYIANLVKNALSDVKTQWNRRQNIWLYGGELNNPDRIGVDDSGGGADSTELLFCNTSANTVGNGCVGVVFTDIVADNTTALDITLPITMTESTSNQLNIRDFVQAGGQWVQPGDYLSLLNLATGKGEYVQVTSIDRSTYTAQPAAGTYAGTGFARLTVVGAGTGGNIVNEYGQYKWTGTGGAQTDDQGTVVHLASPEDVADLGDVTITGAASLQDSDVSGAYPGFGSITGPKHRNKITDNSGNGIPNYLGMTKDQYWSSEVYNFAEFQDSTDINETANMDFLVLDRMLHSINSLHHRRPDCLFMNPQVWMEWVSEAHTNHAFRNASSLTPRPGVSDGSTGVPVNLSYESIEAVTGVGTLQVILDPFCPAYTMYAVNKGDVGYMERFPLTMATDDGSEFRFPTAAVDTLEAFLRVVSTFVALHPASVNKITGIQQDTPVL